MPMIFGQQLSFNFTSPPGVGHVGYPPLWDFSKELGLSKEQMRTLEANSINSHASQELYKLYQQPPDDPAKSRSGETKDGAGKRGGPANVAGGVVLGTTARNTYTGSTTINAGAIVGDAASASFVTANANMPRLTPQLEQKMMQPEFRQRVEELKKQFRQQIEAVLTTQQLTTLKKLALQKAIARRARDPEIPADLHPTEQQKKEMYKLFAANAEIMPRLFREGREKFVETLSPQQQQKCFEELERQEWALVTVLPTKAIRYYPQMSQIFADLRTTLYGSAPKTDAQPLPVFLFLCGSAAPRENPREQTPNCCFNSL